MLRNSAKFIKPIWIRYNSTIGFIGLGNMGLRMVKNLIAKDEALIIFDKNKEILEQFSQSYRNVTVANSLQNIVNESSVVITMLPNGADVLLVYTDKHGLISNCKPNTTFIDCSTIEPSIVQNLAGLADKKSCTFLDAPVSGGVIGAEQGTLTFMLGGCNEKFKEVTLVESLLMKMGSKVMHCGGHGSGQATKLCNNMLLAITMYGLAEVLNLGIRFGLNGKELLSAINSSSGQCWSSEKYPPIPNILDGVPSSNEYKGGFKLDLLIKDMLLARELAKDTSTTLHLSDRVLELYRQASEQKNLGTHDFSVIYKYLTDNN